MIDKLSRITLVTTVTLAVTACGSGSTPFVPAGGNGAAAPAFVTEASIPKVGGVYNGTVVEPSQGRSIKAKLQITLKQSGSKFTGIFDVILKTVHDQFPITKGAVGTQQGKTILHFAIEGSPGRNAKAVAHLTGTKLNGRAKVPPHKGPAVKFKYSATKA
jgi:hypothetical protein